MGTGVITMEATEASVTADVVLLMINKPKSNSTAATVVTVTEATGVTEVTDMAAMAATAATAATVGMDTAVNFTTPKNLTFNTEHWP